MKKFAAYILAAGVILTLTACGGTGSNGTGGQGGTKSAANTDTAMTVPISSSDELEETVNKDVEDTIAGLNKEYQQYKKEISSYEKYVENTDKVEAFYKKIYDTNYELCLRMREYSLNYAQKVVSSDISYDEKYDELEAIYDYVYDDAGDDIYDEIYKGIMDDIYDDYYSGIVKDGYDVAPYKEWSDTLSQEYDWWSDTMSDVYETWSDYHSEVYEFCSDVRSEVYANDMEQANKKIADFKEDIEELKEK